MMGLAVSAPILVLGYGVIANTADAAADAPCVDPNALPANQKSLRRSLNYKVVAPDPKKKCVACAFFTTTAGSCGKCTLLSGGAVDAGSVCDSWALKKG